jgi:hypothetical protein
MNIWIKKHEHLNPLSIRRIEYTKHAIIFVFHANCYDNSLRHPRITVWVTVHRDDSYGQSLLNKYHCDLYVRVVMVPKNIVERVYRSNYKLGA